MKSKELKALNIAIDISNTIDELKENIAFFVPCNVALNMDIVKKMIDNENKENECYNCECNCKNAFGICNQI